MKIALLVVVLIVTLLSVFSNVVLARTFQDDLNVARSLADQVRRELVKTTLDPAAVSEARDLLSQALAALQGGGVADCKTYATSIYEQAGWNTSNAMTKAKSLCTPIEMSNGSVSILRFSTGAYRSAGWGWGQSIEKAAAIAQFLPEFKYSCFAGAYENFKKQGWGAAQSLEKASLYCR